MIFFGGGGGGAGGVHIDISLAAQTLTLYDGGGAVVRRYLVSTAANGGGEQNGSFCTPRGRHIIRAKIGGGAAAGAVFVGRRQTGEVYSPAAAGRRDWILTRILWLSGCEVGRNRLGDVDTMRRYIYIHGAPDSVVLGAPGSIGCVRMANRDIIELYDSVAPYTRVNIF